MHSSFEPRLEVASDQLSVVIPSFERGEILLATLDQLAQQTSAPATVWVIDQTQYLPRDPVAQALAERVQQGEIQWVRLQRPSIPAAMNEGLRAAKTPWVLFLDDDIEIAPNFIEQHVVALKAHSSAAQVGCILQPGESQQARSVEYETGLGLAKDLLFPFYSDSPAFIDNCMAGNFLVDRVAALACGGFDENFEGASYRFETEFCRRLIRATKAPVYFSPLPVLYHLKAERGGTRQFAQFLTSATPAHSQGHYYFILCAPISTFEKLIQSLRVFCVAFFARFYLRKPWYLPLRFVAECRGIARAIKLRRRGPKYADNGSV